LIEVKSSTRIKDEHYTDLAVQAYVVEGAGLKVRRCYLMHVDSSYEYGGGDYDLEKLFAVAEVTNEVKDLHDMVQERLGSMWTILQQKAIPDIGTGPQCNKPYQCSFHSYCRKGWPEDHISSLPRASARLITNLTESGIVRISEIPESFIGLTLTQQRVRECVVHGKAYYELEMLRTLQGLEFPLFFIDFETFNPALPIFAGTHPFQQLPFQWSAHVLRSRSEIEHFEFLATGDVDPRETFGRSLIELLGSVGPILVYSPFEKTCLSGLAKALPEFASELEKICARMVDLLALIRQHFYHPGFGGSFSIKQVLPALVPDLSYKGMEIANGAVASASFAKIASGAVSSEDVGTIRANLLAYCKLDTLAMVRVYQRLLEEDFAKCVQSTS
jgi:hypothetical protein